MLLGTAAGTNVIGLFTAGFSQKSIKAGLLNLPLPIFLMTFEQATFDVHEDIQWRGLQDLCCFSNW